MNNTPADGYVALKAEEIERLCLAKIAALDEAEQELHENRIRALMVNRRQFSWWSGWKPAPDVDYETASEEYNRPIMVGGLLFPSHRERIEGRYAELRSRATPLLLAARTVGPKKSILVSVNVLEWLSC